VTALTRAFAVAAAAIVAVLIAVLVWPHSPASSPAAAERRVTLPASPRPALRVPRPVLLSHSAGTSYWASVRRDALARAAPSPRARVVSPLTTTTPEGTTNIVLVLGRSTNSAGRLWVHVRLPVLPNGRTGWVPRDALGVYGVVHTRLVVDLERLTATLLRGKRSVLRAPVGVGQPQWPTPTGEFYIRNVLTSFSSPFYGPVAFGTSARSSVLTDWPGGGFIGIHGTDLPQLLPGRVSHGCIRLRNDDILRLRKLMPVGTPVTIR
jgi:lipoprotein-anchoring transpeptidase ErfK/SrfK